MDKQNPIATGCGLGLELAENMMDMDYMIFKNGLFEFKKE